MNCLILALLCLVFAGCSSKNDLATAMPPSPADRYVESLNTASGGFSVPAELSENKQPFTISVTQAYARVVKGLKDPREKDVLIVLLEKPLPRQALAVVEDDSDAQSAEQQFFDVLQNRDARGLVFRVPLDRQVAESPTVWALFNGNQAHLGNLVPRMKSLAADKAEGQLVGDVESQKSDVSFNLRLQPNVWTGGTFYQQPPTNLSAGQASGQIEIDGRSVAVNHAFARLIDIDMFDESKSVYEVWLTEKPIDPKLIVNSTPDNLLVMKQSGNGIVFNFTSAGPIDRSDLSFWRVGDVRAGTVGEQHRQLLDLFDEIPGAERDYVRFGNDAIEGRLFTAFPVKEGNHVYKVDVLFNAAMMTPAVSDGPVTEGNGGTALPADGGEPYKAYLAAMDRMKAAKDFDQKLAVWLSVVPAADAEKIKKDLESLSPEQRQVLIEVFAPLDEVRFAGGFSKDNKATLRLAGDGREGRANEVVNMHLENGQWKIGRREIREE